MTVKRRNRKEHPGGLTTARLELRSLQPDDAEALCRLSAELQQACPGVGEPRRSIAETREVLELLSDLELPSGGLLWGIVRRSDRRLIGSCGLHNFHRQHRRVELGYELSPSCWGQGYMQEALNAAIAHAFGVLEVHRIEAFVGTGNERSLRLLQRLGFVHEGVLRGYERRDGRFVDMHCLSLLEPAAPDTLREEERCSV